MTNAIYHHLLAETEETGPSGYWRNDYSVSPRNSAHAEAGPLALQMGLQEPEVLVDVARHLGEEVGGVFVPVLIGRVDGLSHAGGEGGVPIRQGSDVAETLEEIDGVFVERRSLGRHAGRTKGGHAHRVNPSHPAAWGGTAGKEGDSANTGRRKSARRQEP